MSATLATFLHISDLHFGHRFEGHGPGRLDPEVPGSAKVLPVAEGLLGHHNAALDELDAFWRRLKDLAQTRGEPAPQVITTGDLTQDGHLVQLAFADQFIGSQLPVNFRSRGLQQPRWRELAIPGNHDHWCGPNVLQPLRPPRNVPKGPSSIKIDEEFDWFPTTTYALDQNRFIEFIRIDTDADVGPKSSDRTWARGAFQSELQALAHLPRRDPNGLRVLLMHHSPSHANGSWKRKLEINPSSRADLEAFLEGHEISIVLTGHVHRPLVDLFSTANQQWTVLEARCGATTARDRVPKAWGDNKKIDPNTAMVHRVIEDGDQLCWETRTCLRSNGTGFGDPSKIDADATAKGWNARAAVWSDPLRPLASLTRF